MHVQSEKDKRAQPYGVDVGRTVEEEVLPSQHNEQLASAIEFKRRSRDNRKGRHALVVQSSSTASAGYLTPEAISGIRSIAKGVWRMFTHIPYWDVSYLVAVIFTLGSAVWVINAFFAFLPDVQPRTDFANEILVGGGVSASIGATVFEIGSFLLMIEAMNEDRAGCFGLALQRAIVDEGRKAHKIWVRTDRDNCRHHHTNRGNLVGKGSVQKPADMDSDMPSSSTSEANISVHEG